MRALSLVAGGVIGGLVLGGGVATAVVKTPSSVKACVDSKGVLSLMSHGSCVKGTKALRLGVTGKTGKTGPAGAKGLNGTNGPSGTNGTNGINGSNGTNGTNGTNGRPGPSDVYGWSGLLDSSAPLTSVVTVPAGDYVVEWTGFLNNYNGTSPASRNCYLNIGSNGSSVTTTAAAGQVVPISYKELVHATASFATQVYCTGLGNVYLNDVVLTATATGELHATGVITP